MDDPFYKDMHGCVFLWTVLKTAIILFNVIKKNMKYWGWENGIMSSEKLTDHAVVL